MTIGGLSNLVIIAALLALTGCGSEKEPRVAPGARAAAESIQPATAASDPSASPRAEASKVVPEQSPSPESIRYVPRDDCAGLKGWPSFRKALSTAIRARDSQALAKLAAPDIALDYGGGNGPGELVKRLDDPDRALWHELEAIMPLGCAAQGGLAAMPWVFWNVPEDIDSESAMLVLGDDTAMLEKPGGQHVATAGWTIVGIDPLDFHTDAKSTRVTTRNGQKGWIETHKLRSLLDYRLIAEPNDGTWKITAFIAGD